MKPSDSPVYDCINENHKTFAKEDVDFQEVDNSDDGDFEIEDEKHLLDLVPSVLETMNKIARSSVIFLLPLFNSIPEVVMPSSYKTPDECLDFLYVQKTKNQLIIFHFISY
jgi:hypothetical protein